MLAGLVALVAFRFSGRASIHAVALAVIVACAGKDRTSDQDCYQHEFPTSVHHMSEVFIASYVLRMRQRGRTARNVVLRASVMIQASKPAIVAKKYPSAAESAVVAGHVGPIGSKGRQRKMAARAEEACAAADRFSTH